MKDIFKVTKYNKASCLVQFFIKHYGHDEMRITREQIRPEFTDNPEESSWSEDNEEVSYFFDVLVELISWLKKQRYLSFIEDIPGSNNKFPPYDSPELEKHLYWLIVHPEHLHR
jgi:hypothetical protein